ncbi:hypothetical protein PVAND_014409 [Polypedilum vanderplanki]|uniref:Uncharacterized protein n=1 Tax=Polypedilum vanderplanki TaxID=319348 RepID=A0A9J6B9C0_POLVA|nr:hypothetical protein PVAND_014409 [Polypedilum vanderplanki]
MADEHDDLLNFEIGENDYADGALNEDELLLSDEDENKEPPAKKQRLPSVSLSETTKNEEEKEQKLEPEVEVKKFEENKELERKNEENSEEQQQQQQQQNDEIDENVVELQPEEDFNDIHSEQSEESNVPEKSQHHQQQFHPSIPQQQPPFRPQQQFRPQRFQPRGLPRWMGPGQNPPFSGAPPLTGRMGIGPQQRMPPNMRPGPFPLQRGNFFMQQRPGPIGQPNIRPQRFFYPNPNNNAPPVPQPVPAPTSYVPTPIVHPAAASASASAMPRKVLINPNFKGGVEAVKSQLLKDFSSTSSLAPMSEEELLRKQQEFINRNMRSIEKRRHERSPSPSYRRSYSHSPSPPRFNHRRRPSFKRYERRRSEDSNKNKDENHPEEDEETRAYREKIETQRKQREELIKQKEMRRKQQMEAKAKETEPLKPIVVTEKKIILTKKTRSDEKSTTPPIDDAPLPVSLTSGRKILLKSKEDVKIGIAGSEKQKLQKIIKAEN